jgi:hypothetical protein
MKDYMLAFASQWENEVERDHLNFLVTSALATGQVAVIETVARYVAEITRDGPGRVGPLHLARSSCARA